MCPHCRAFITTSDKVCPYCDTPVGPRAIDIRSPADLLGGLVPGGRFLTSLILLLNGGLFAVTVLYSLKAGYRGAPMNLDIDTLVIFGAKRSDLVFDGHWWRLLSAGFLHGGLLHFGMNTWAMLDVASTVEELFGTARMIAIYVVSTIAGFLASTYWTWAVSVGASAGLFGLIGAMIAYGSMRSSDLGQMIKTHYTRWAIYGLIFGLMGNIDNAAHLGGLAGGFAVARLAGEPTLRPGREAAWSWVSYACLAVAAYSFGMMGLSIWSNW
jgi:rhomboid protease GluP